VEAVPRSVLENATCGLSPLRNFQRVHCPLLSFSRWPTTIGKSSTVERVKTGCDQASFPLSISVKGPLAHLFKASRARIDFLRHERLPRGSHSKHIGGASLHQLPDASRREIFGTRAPFSAGLHILLQQSHSTFASPVWLHGLEGGQAAARFSRPSPPLPCLAPRPWLLWQGAPPSFSTQPQQILLTDGCIRRSKVRHGSLFACVTLINLHRAFDSSGGSAGCHWPREQVGNHAGLQQVETEWRKKAPCHSNG
jgi:hypothetical protein